MKLLDNDNTGMKDIIGLRRGFKLLLKIRNSENSRYLT